MTRSELANTLAAKNNISVKLASNIVTTFFDAIQNSLVSGGRVELRGFGSFFVKEYDGYEGRNPKTGGYVSVKPKKLPGFRMGKDIKIRLR